MTNEKHTENTQNINVLPALIRKKIRTLIETKTKVFCDWQRVVCVCEDVGKLKKIIDDTRDLRLYGSIERRTHHCLLNGMKGNESRIEISSQL